LAIFETMNTLNAIFLATAALFFLAGCTSSPLSPFHGTVLRVHDGDTILVKDGNELRKIRLARIDAPELKQDFGLASRNRLAYLCDGKNVSVIPSAMDRDNRLIADVQLDGTSLNQQLVREGLAWWYRDFDRVDPLLEKFESDARMRHLGLWKASKPVPPWDFRKERRDEIAYWRAWRRMLVVAASLVFVVLSAALLLFVTRKK
jgi:endonuclease YncB( thermonuclease family)